MREGVAAYVAHNRTLIYTLVEGLIFQISFFMFGTFYSRQQKPLCVYHIETVTFHF